MTIPKDPNTSCWSLEICGVDLTPLTRLARRRVYFSPTYPQLHNQPQVPSQPKAFVEILNLSSREAPSFCTTATPQQNKTKPTSGTTSNAHLRITGETLAPRPNSFSSYLKRPPQKYNHSRNISSPRERNTSSLAASTSFSKSILSRSCLNSLVQTNHPSQLQRPPYPNQSTSPAISTHEGEKFHSLDQQPVADSRQSSILQNSIFQRTLKLSLPSHGLIE
ncbi:hypothetical protein BKA61DRAFT_41350 [Leptodontidium sp. MPI-SDFR-AT-0119]|nr:hypothetical protein BKA61DRAFT_41350 [Leptodontidium sp. MPI-SDFR-AT-0119]